MDENEATPWTYREFVDGNDEAILGNGASAAYASSMIDTLRPFSLFNVLYITVSTTQLH